MFCDWKSELVFFAVVLLRLMMRFRLPQQQINLNRCSKTFFLPII